MTTIFKYISLVFLVFCLFQKPIAQSIDHWESIVYANDVWKYFPGTLAPPSDWYVPEFDDSSWQEGSGGIGYGDGDDNTVISPTLSVFQRIQFEVSDLPNIEKVVLHADYDDAFVAFLNGEEIARANIGVSGDHPAYNQKASGLHEAQLYQAGKPALFIIPTEILQEGTNTLAAQVHNEDVNSSDLSGLFFLSIAIKDSSFQYRSVPFWFYEPFNSSDLPLMIINTHGQSIMNEPRITADMGIVDNGPGDRNYTSDVFNGYSGKITIEIRGASSTMFPKNNFSFETQDEEGENRNVSLLGMPKENDWVLHGPYSDKSLMRNALTYYIGRDLRGYAPRTRFCELVINDDYRGVYLLTERIKRDKNRVDIAKLRPEDISGDELTGGYIFQIDRDRPNVDDGWYSSHSPNPFYAYDDPDYDQLMTEQKYYIQNHVADFENMMAGSDYVAQLENYIDIPSYVDYWIVNEIPKNIDGFRLSFFMYKRKDSNGGKIHFGPVWDLNLGYGNFDYSCDPGPSGWCYDFSNTCNSPLPFWINRITNHPEVKFQINCRWAELRESTLHTDTLLQYIENTASLLEEAQERNFTRWGVLGQYVWPNNFVGQTYESELEYMKDWLIDRLEWMDNNMIGSCDPNDTISTPEPTGAPFSVHPNPVFDELNVSWPVPYSLSGKIILTTSLGEKVAEQKIPFIKNSLTINTSSLSPGIYFYYIFSKKEVKFSGKLVKL